MQQRVAQPRIGACLDGAVPQGLGHAQHVVVECDGLLERTLVVVCRAKVAVESFHMGFTPRRLVLHLASPILMKLPPIVDKYELRTCANLFLKIPNSFVTTSLGILNLLPLEKSLSQIS